jgi:hypothetical protein
MATGRAGLFATCRFFAVLAELQVTRCILRLDVTTHTEHSKDFLSSVLSVTSVAIPYGHWPTDLALLFVAVSLGRDAREFAEEGGEVALVFEARAQADLDNRQVLVSEQMFGRLDAALHQKLDGR